MVEEEEDTIGAVEVVEGQGLISFMGAGAGGEERLSLSCEGGTVGEGESDSCREGGMEEGMAWMRWGDGEGWMAWEGGEEKGLARKSCLGKDN